MSDEWKLLDTGDDDMDDSWGLYSKLKIVFKLSLKCVNVKRDRPMVHKHGNVVGGGSFQHYIQNQNSACPADNPAHFDYI